MPLIFRDFPLFKRVVHGFGTVDILAAEFFRRFDPSRRTAASLLRPDHPEADDPSSQDSIVMGSGVRGHLGTSCDGVAHDHGSRWPGLRGGGRCGGGAHHNITAESRAFAVGDRWRCRSNSPGPDIVTGFPWSIVLTSGWDLWAWG